MKTFPASFTESNDICTVVIVDQTHHEELRDGVKQRTVKLTIEWDGTNVVIPITVTEGARKDATSQLTLNVEDTRRLIQYLSQAIEDVEQYVESTKT